MALRLHGKKIQVVLAGFFCLLLLVYVSDRILTTTAATSLGKPIESIKTEEKVLAFTINVDWGEEYLPEIFQILKQAQAKATFFVTGRWAKNHPDLVRQMMAEGHEVENHGYRHPHPDNLSVADNKEEIKKTESILQGMLGYQTKYYAPPYGEDGPSGLRAADELGYKTILWTLDTVDWQTTDPEVIIQRVVRPAMRHGAQPDKRGAIVLMHPKEQTVKALPEMVAQLRSEGFRLVTVAELIRLEEKSNP
ncbi:MAG: polysaccharide deacetylase family protein [Peptococcaceae bacterium]|nr:polysaccharide deacetylase family protein [Peptococcaceae bacterium]